MEMKVYPAEFKADAVALYLSDPTGCRRRGIARVGHLGKTL
ncbi:hypothetical protein ACQEV4_31185 [Streptomyces shenzhenensis]